MINTEKEVEDFFTLSTGRDIKMTYGLLNRLGRIVGGAENVGLVFIDFDIQEVVLVNLLSVYDAKGKVLEKADIDAVELYPVEVNKLLAWAVEHLTNFFLQSLASTERPMALFQKMAEQSLKHLPTGLKT